MSVLYKLAPPAPAPVPGLVAQRIVESIVGTVVWIAPDDGYCTCPGADLHSNKNGKRDCRVYLKGAPSFNCFHTSCAAVIEEKNRILRSQIGKAERGGNYRAEPWKPSPEDVERERERQRHKVLRERAAAYLPTVLREYKCNRTDLWESSPCRLNETAESDWRLILELFKPDDVVWIGAKEHSAAADRPDWQKQRAAEHFRTVTEWLKEKKAPEQFTCPNVFKPGSFSRSNENATRKYLVVESDTLKKGEACALIRWLATKMKLRAVVDTGGKSLHGWFEPPTDPKDLGDLKEVLPAMQCDPKMFTLSQPCRLPGARREEKFQCLLYLDLGGIQ